MYRSFSNETPSTSCHFSYFTYEGEGGIVCSRVPTRTGSQSYICTHQCISIVAYFYPDLFNIRWYYTIEIVKIENTFSSQKNVPEYKIPYL